MTVSSATSRVEYAGNGSTTAFAVPFYFIADGDLKVYVDATLQVITTNYTVSGAGVLSGGTVTFGTAPANGTDVVIFRDPTRTQTLDYTENDNFPAESHELGLDRLTMIAQRNRDLSDRAVRIQDFQTGFDPELPEIVASRLIGTDATGEALQFYNFPSDNTQTLGTYSATLTPSVSGSISLNGTGDTLSYVKIGRFVHVTGRLGVSAVSSPVGHIQVNLPFQIGNFDDQAGGFSASVTMSNVVAANVSNFIGIGSENETIFKIYLGDSNNLQEDSAQEVQANTAIWLGISYFASS